MKHNLYEAPKDEEMRNKEGQHQCHIWNLGTISWKTGKKKIQGVPQSQAAALPKHQEEEETDKTKQAQIEQTYNKD